MAKQDVEDEEDMLYSNEVNKEAYIIKDNKQGDYKD
jgi:hypothetical protein